MKKSKKSTSKPAKAQENVPKPILKKPKSAGATNGDLPKAVPVKVTSEPARQIRPRKRAADFLSDDEGEEGDHEKSKKKQPVASSPAAAKSTSIEADKPSKKKSKKGAAEVPESSTPSAKNAAATKADSGKEASSTGKPSKKSKDAAAPSKEISKPIAEDEKKEGSEGEEEDDDQTAALIQGFESSGDEDISGDEGFEPGKEVPAIPDAKQMKRKLRKMKKSGTAEEPGTVYVG